MILNQGVLESPEPGAYNGGLNLFFRLLGIDLVTFELAGWPQNLSIFITNLLREFYKFWAHPATSKVTRSAPNGPKNKYDPLLYAPASELSREL